MTSLDMRSNSAVMKRAEQLKRWEESDTNQAPSAPRPEKGRKIKFSSGCVFLAACSSADKDEVLSLLENGADINTANVDGLTALHQACIDDNLEMVEFLVEHGADINRQDNEGWTPLHATASCGFVSIARYLVENGADVAAVNSDGDLAVDLAIDIQHVPMIEYMQKVVNEHNIDLQKARDAELDQMLKDAKQWLRSDASEADKIHPKTGATALHVAAAKGYTKVLSLLLAGRANVDKQDNDGWTPLHAASHWGQKEAAEMLVNAMADMDIRNYSGLTCIDVADRKMVKFLEELRASNKRTKRRPSSQIRISDTIENHNTGSKIIRVEVKPDQTKEQANGETTIHSSASKSNSNELPSVTINNDSDGTDSDLTDSTESSHSTSLSETEDDKAKNTTESATAFKASATEAPAEEEAPWRRNSSARVRTQNDSPTKNQVPDRDVSKSNSNTDTSDVILRRTQSFENDEKFYQKYNELRARIKANSCPILPASEISNSNNSNSNRNSNNNNNNNNINNNNNNNESNINRISSSNVPPSSVALARLYLTTNSASTISPAITTSTTSTTSITATTTTTTTITPTSTIPVQINTVQRSASLKDHRSIRKHLTSTPGTPANVTNVGNPTTVSTVTNTTTTNTAAASGTPIRSAHASSNINSSVASVNSSAENNKNQNNASNNNNNNNNGSKTSTSSTPTSPAPDATAVPTKQKMSAGTIFKNFFKSFVPPVRDEESETQRKAHAKRVRETRRSTQGVTLDEIKSAEELVKKKNANMNNNNNSGNIMDPTKSISMQENVTPFEQADEYEQQLEPISSTSSSLISTECQQELIEDALPSTFEMTVSTNDKEIDEEVAKTLPIIPLPPETVVQESLRSPNITGHHIADADDDDDNCTTNDNTGQEKSDKKENNSAVSSIIETTNNDKNSISSADENIENAENDENEICVNFTIKRNDKTTSSPITMESVEETVTVAHPAKSVTHKNPTETISNINAAENIDSVYEFQHISPLSLSGNYEEQKNQSDTSENDSNINVNSNIETEKTDLNEKTTQTSKTILIKDLDGNSSEYLIPSVASTTSLIKRMRATASSLSPLIYPTVESAEPTITTTTTITTISTLTATPPATPASTPTQILESPVRLRDKRSLFDLEKRHSETQKQQLYETNLITSPISNSNTCNNSEAEPESIYHSGSNEQSNSLTMHCRESTTTGGNNINTSSYSGISATERRPSWRLKFSNDSKFKLEDVNTGATFPPNNSTIIPSAPAVIAAANQRRINSVGNTISSSNQSLNSIGRPVSAPATAVISNSNNNTGSNAGSVLSCGDNNTSNEKPNDNSNSTSNIGGIVGRKYNVTTSASANVTTSSTAPTAMVSTNTTAKSSKEDNDNDKENDSRSALATQAVIQRRRKPKRRSTGVVHLDMDDLDPERQDSANDADEKESGSEQRSSRSRVGSSTASSSNTSAATKNDSKSQNQTENGEPDYKALWQAARLENDQLKLELLKKDEQLVQTNAAMSRITNATTKNSLSELEKRERRAMERKLSELEEELKQLDFYKAENLRLKEENGALIRVISKLSK